MEYYITELAFGKNSIYTIWFSDDVCGFVCENDRIVPFGTYDEALQYAHDHGLVIAGKDCICCSAWDMTKPEQMLDMWNIASDAAGCVGESFAGDEKECGALYEKLFSFCEIGALGQRSSSPQWTVQEKGELMRVMRSARRIIEYALTPVPVCGYLYAAVNSGYYDYDTAMEMILGMIERTDSPDEWLIECALCRDINELISAMAPYSDGMLSSPMDAYVGYCYLMYMENRLSMCELLERCGFFCDAYGPIDCEEFFFRLTGLESDPSLENDEAFGREIYELCRYEVVSAQKSLEIIRKYVEK